MPKFTYSTLDVMLASPTEPIPLKRREYQLKYMRAGLKNLEESPEPTIDDWSAVSDAVNIMETLVKMEYISDPDGAIEDSVDTLGRAGGHYMNGLKLYVDAKGLKTLKDIMEDYEMILSSLPARVMVVAHRTSEKRLFEKLKRKA